jgi:DNA-binding transcriptional LysR family regulator
LNPDFDFDLNLIRIFIAVYDERGVSAAAQALGMSQPGLSTALARLRKRLGDPLFTKGASGMEPTSRARDMIAAARAVVETVRGGILAAPGFDASTSTHEFVIALSDIGEGIYLPLLLNAIERTAPHVTLRSVFLTPRDLEEAMAEGEVHVASGFYPDIRTANFFHRRVNLHSFACIARADHPTIRGTMTFEEFCTSGHVAVEATGRSLEVFERFLKSRRIRRRVVLRSPHFMSVPAIVASTNAIAVVPQALADLAALLPNMQQVKLPFKPPTFQVNLYWHRSMQHDPACKWIRELIIDALPELRARDYARNG